MKEQFDFKKLEDQKKFDHLPGEEKKEVIDRSHDEANQIQGKAEEIAKSRIIKTTGDDYLRANKIVEAEKGISKQEVGQVLDKFDLLMHQIMAADKPEKLAGIYSKTHRHNQFCLKNEQKDKIDIEIQRKMQAMKGEYADWSEAYERITYNPKSWLKEMIAKKMVETARDFSQWKLMLNRSACFGKYEETILKSMLDLSNDLESLMIIYRESREDSEIRSETIRKIIGGINDFESWFKAYCLSPEESILRKRVFDLYGNIEVTPDQLLHAYRSNFSKKHKARNMLELKIMEVRNSPK